MVLILQLLAMVHYLCPLHAQVAHNLQEDFLHKYQHFLAMGDPH
jgi:hypothetical protein